MNNQNNRQVGNHYEEIACKYILDNGGKILERNFRNRFGEIDIILLDGNTLVFCEVKYRKNGKAGFAGSAVNYRKQHIICKVADYYRMLHQIDDDMPVRYDCILIDATEVKWLKNAFSHIQ